MPKSVVYLRRKQVFFYDFKDVGEADDLLAFLRLMFQLRGEHFSFSRNEDGVLVDYSAAPKTWALDQAMRAGEVRPVYDGEYIHFKKPTPAN
jgi:hypothetical protein